MLISAPVLVVVIMLATSKAENGKQ